VCFREQDVFGGTIQQKRAYHQNGVAMNVELACRLCHGKRWICEAHPDQPWPHDDCPGAGDPCYLCNTSEPPIFPIVRVNEQVKR